MHHLEALSITEVAIMQSKASQRFWPKRIFDNKEPDFEIN